MQKPRPEDFGLTESQVKDLAARLEAEDNERLRNIMLWSIGGVGGVFFLAFVDRSGLFVASLNAIFLGGMLGSILGLILYAIVPSSNRSERGLLTRYQESQRKYEQWLIMNQREFWQRLTGQQFEQAIAKLFSDLGYLARLTPLSGDKGIDIWLNKGGKKIAVQCKAHKNPVGPSIARDLYGAMMHGQADEAILISLNGFTQGVGDFVKGKPIQLMSLSDILRLQNQL